MKKLKLKRSTIQKLTDHDMGRVGGGLIITFPITTLLFCAPLPPPLPTDSIKPGGCK